MCWALNRPWRGCHWQLTALPRRPDRRERRGSGNRRNRDAKHADCFAYYVHGICLTMSLRTATQNPLFAE
jgi:hypothetical protein